MIESDSVAVIESGSIAVLKSVSIALIESGSIEVVEPDGVAGIVAGLRLYARQTGKTGIVLHSFITEPFISDWYTAGLLSVIPHTQKMPFSGTIRPDVAFVLSMFSRKS